MSNIGTPSLAKLRDLDRMLADSGLSPDLGWRKVLREAIQLIEEASNGSK